MNPQIDNSLALMSVLLVETSAIGRTSLNKLLFFADVASYLKDREKISSVNYIKLEYGPVPENIEQTRAHLVNSGLIRKSVDLVGSFIQHTYEGPALVDAERNKIRVYLGDKKYDIVMNVKRALAQRSATYLSDLSHRYEPWKSASYYSKLDFSKASQDADLRAMLVSERILDS